MNAWTASPVDLILKMRIKDALLKILIGNMVVGAIVSEVSLHIMQPITI